VIFEKFDTYQNNTSIRNGPFLIVVNGYRRCLIEYKNNFVETIEVYGGDGKGTKLSRQYRNPEKNTPDKPGKINITGIFGVSGEIDLTEIAKANNISNLISTGPILRENKYETFMMPLAYKILNKDIPITEINTSFHSNGVIDEVVIYSKNTDPVDRILILKYDKKQNPLYVDTNFTIIKTDFPPRVESLSKNGYFFKISKTISSRDEKNGKYYTTEFKKQLNNDYYFETIKKNPDGKIIEQYIEVISFDDPNQYHSLSYYDGARLESYSGRTWVTNYSVEKSKKNVDHKDLKNGEEIAYFEYPDKIESKCVFANDQLVGNAIKYWPSGLVKENFNYIITNEISRNPESVKNGEQNEYYESGILMQKEYYNNGKLVSFEKYNPDGSILQKGNY
jgi:antitoxin component YwqK of YwqJK toxin-antitoxin module